MGANGKRAARSCTRHPGGHNLSKSDTVALRPNDPTRTDDLTWHAHPNGRPHPARHGAPTRTVAHGSKRAARTCTRHPGSHNLANMTRAPSGQTTRPDPNERPRTARPPERTPSCRTTKRHDPNGRPHPARPNDPTRTDALARHDRTTRPNGRTWEQTANGPPGRAQGTRAVTT